MWNPSKKNIPIPIVIFAYSLLFYVACSLLIFKSVFSKTAFPYYNYLLDAFFHGRLNLLSPILLDLSVFQEKLFMWWGPAPSLFILPFYLVSGTNASDVLYTLLAGTLNITLLFFTIKEFVIYFKLRISYFSIIFIIVSFALISPNFSLSLLAGVWSTYQTIACTYLLLFYLFFFKFLNAGYKNLYLLALAVVFFNLSWLSRGTLVINGLLLLYPLFLSPLSLKKRYLKKYLLITATITTFFLLIFLTYNFLRFHNPLEIGLRFQQGNIRYEQAYKENMIFSRDYFTHNFSIYFLNHISFSLESPYLKNISREGNSIFSMYPYLFLLFFLLQKKHLRKTRYSGFLILSLLVIGSTIGLLLFFFSTGWDQFGIRYALDIIPLSLLLILFILNAIPLPAKLIILLYGIVINFAGFFYYIHVPF